MSAVGILLFMSAVCYSCWHSPVLLYKDITSSVITQIINNTFSVIFLFLSSLSHCFSNFNMVIRASIGP